jgi:O-methyltransferase
MLDAAVLYLHRGTSGVVRGGYFFMHDYNSPESDWTIRRAVAEFMQDKPELLRDVPDLFRSAVFRKI